MKHMPEGDKKPTFEIDDQKAANLFTRLRGTEQQIVAKAKKLGIGPNTARSFIGISIVTLLVWSLTNR